MSGGWSRSEYRLQCAGAEPGDERDGDAAEDAGGQVGDRHGQECGAENVVRVVVAEVDASEALKDGEDGGDHCKAPVEEPESGDGCRSDGGVSAGEGVVGACGAGADEVVVRQRVARPYLRDDLLDDLSDDDRSAAASLPS